MSINTHTFFCCEPDCEKEVEEIGMSCEEHTLEGAETYCVRCWPDECECPGEETCRRQNCECRHAPMCKPCERYFGYDEEDDHYCGLSFNCIQCKCTFKNKYWRNQFICVECEFAKYRTPDDVRDEIAKIEEKLATTGRQMTPAQYEDWHKLLRAREVELAEMMAEMWEGYDQDDLRKLDLQNRRGY